MTALPAAPADSFDHMRASRVAHAAAAIGLRPAERPTDQQLAHLAWHVAAIEPSQLSTLHGAPLAVTPGSACLRPHRPDPDVLDDVLPLPHPLDYEWRYEPHTRHLLARRCEDLAGARGPIALLGTPTLAPEFRNRRAEVLLLDSNIQLLRALSDSAYLGNARCFAVDIALFQPPTAWRQRAAVVVCDPPWYPDAFGIFLRASADLVRPGGVVLLSVPDVLTRPSISRELDDLMHLAAKLRLTLTESAPGALRYRTPFFEFRALQAAGLRAVPLDWRAGTLWQLTSNGIADARGLGPRQSRTGPAVAEATIDNIRIRVIHVGQVQPGTLSLRSAVPGDTLPTVSRQHPARSRANMWTSGNTILSCPDPNLLGVFLRYLTDPSEGIRGDRDLVAHEFAAKHRLPLRDVTLALEKILSIVNAEEADYYSYRTATSHDTPKSVLAQQVTADTVDLCRSRSPR